MRNVDWGFVVLLLFFVIRTKNQKIASLPGSNDLLEVANPLIPRHVGSAPWNECFAMFLGLQHRIYHETEGTLSSTAVPQVSTDILRLQLVASFRGTKPRQLPFLLLGAPLKFVKHIETR